MTLDDLNRLRQGAADDIATLPPARDGRLDALRQIRERYEETRTTELLQEIRDLLVQQNLILEELRSAD